MVRSKKVLSFVGLILSLAVILLASAPALAGQGDLEWEFNSGDGASFRGGAAISPNGTIYVGNTHGRLYAIDSTTAEEWVFDAAGMRNATPALGPDGTIYVGARDGFLYAVTPGGTQSWFYNAGSPIEASPAISANGTIFILTTAGGFRAVYPNGAEWLSVDTGSQSYRGSVSISPNGTCYYGGSNGVVYARTPAAEEWTLSTSKNIAGTIAISANGTLYVPADDELWAVSKAGSKLWGYSVGGSIYGSPVISANGTIYVSDTTNNKIHAVTPSGSAEWVYSTTDLKSSPVISANGTIYFTRDLYPVNALSPAGVLKWSYRNNHGARSYPVIGPDGTVYAGDNAETVSAVTGDGYGLGYSSWPYYRADIHGAGRARSFLTLPDSGQTLCFNAAGDIIDCPASGANFYGQDAQYNGSQPRFQVYEDETKGNVTLDLNTNLMWQYKGGANMPSANAEAYCKDLVYGGYADWRLPTVPEIFTIANYNSSRVCYSSFVCNASEYWIGNLNSRSRDRRYFIDLRYGGALGATANSDRLVRCVRGRVTPPSYLAANRSKIVKDATTGLVWQRDGSTAGTGTWQNALNYCASLDLGGRTDWRLPNLTELLSIADFANASLPVASPFENVHGASYYWTSTTAPGSANALTDNAMALAFSNSEQSYASIGIDPYAKTKETLHTLCVCNGSAGSPDRTAVINGAPSGTTSATTAVLTVSGTGVNRYRYKLDSGNYSDVIGSTAKIRLSGLSKASHTVSVLGISGDPGKVQANPTTATWTVGSGGSQEVKTKDGTNPHTDPDAADADTDITYPEYQEAQYTGTVNTILTDMGYAAMGSSLGNYSAWQNKVTDATALGYLKANDSTDIKKGINLLSTSGSVDRVLTGMVNASCTSLTNGYCLFVRNTTNLAKTYHVSNLRYAKVMGDNVELINLATTAFDNSVTSDIYVYLRKADGTVVSSTFTGEASTCVWVKDNGAYDAIDTAGTVADPGYVTSLASASSSSSTGCMMNPTAGFGLEWLLVLLAPAVIWLRRRR